MSVKEGERRFAMTGRRASEMGDVGTDFLYKKNWEIEKKPLILNDVRQRERAKDISGCRHLLN